MSEDDGDEGRRRRPRGLVDKQRQHLEKLMANPEKPVSIPEGPRDWKPPEPPEFVRFYMGSSAGAGSEVFHVYRHLRRKEMLRQEWIEEEAERERVDEEFHDSLAAKRMKADEKTAKKRAKRLRKKQHQREHKKATKSDPENEEPKAASGSEEGSGDEQEEEHFVIGGR